MKITFVTFHNWETKRHGGFHALAQHCADLGHETIFFSFSRPYSTFFIQDERRNRNVLRKLIKGVYYKTEKGSKITNITWPTFAFPLPYRKLFPLKINYWLETHSFISFNKFADKWLTDTDCFIIESCESVLLYPLLRKKYPNAVIAYRPSDPLVGLLTRYIDAQELQLVKNADYNFLVNTGAVELYKKYIPDFEESCNYEILPNGIYLDEYRRCHPKPKELKGSKTVLYVGVWPVEWELVVETAKTYPDVDFYIVSPTKVEESILHQIDAIENLHYIPGIPPKDVVAWVSNCDICITPMKTGFNTSRPNMSLTAKDIKAMAARKPIITYCVNEEIKKYGISTTFTFEDFINEVGIAISEDYREYTIDFQDYDWQSIGDTFINKIEELCKI